MPRAARGVGRDEQVVRTGLVLGYIRRDERERTLGGEVGAGDAAVMRGNSEAVFLVFHDRTVRGQAVERVLYLLLAGFRQGAAQLIQPHGLREQRKQPAFRRMILHK